MAGLIPIPPSPRRNGFPWLGLMMAIIIVIGVVAHWLGGNRAMLLTGIYFGVVVGPLVMALFIFDAFRKATKKPGDDSSV